MFKLWMFSLHFCYFSIDVVIGLLVLTKKCVKKTSFNLDTILYYKTAKNISLQDTLQETYHISHNIIFQTYIFFIESYLFIKISFNLYSIK